MRRAFPPIVKHSTATFHLVCVHTTHPPAPFPTVFITLSLFYFGIFYFGRLRTLTCTRMFSPSSPPFATPTPPIPSPRSSLPLQLVVLFTRKTHNYRNLRILYSIVGGAGGVGERRMESFFKTKREVEKCKHPHTIHQRALTKVDLKYKKALS